MTFHIFIWNWFGISKKLKFYIFSQPREFKNVYITLKYFSFFENKPPVSWVAHVTRDFFTCSCPHYSSMIYATMYRKPSWFEFIITVLTSRKRGIASSFCTPYTCLQQRRIQNPFKHLRWIAFEYPVNDFKLFTVYPETPTLRCLKAFWICLCSDCTW